MASTFCVSTCDDCFNRGLPSGEPCPRCGCVPVTDVADDPYVAVGTLLRSRLRMTPEEGQYYACSTSGRYCGEGLRIRGDRGSGFMSIHTADADEFVRRVSSKTGRGFTVRRESIWRAE